MQQNNHWRSPMCAVWRSHRGNGHGNHHGKNSKEHFPDLGFGDLILGIFPLLEHNSHEMDTLELYMEHWRMMREGYHLRHVSGYIHPVPAINHWSGHGLPMIEWPECREGWADDTFLWAKWVPTSLSGYQGTKLMCLPWILKSRVQNWTFQRTLTMEIVRLHMKKMV